MPTSTLPTDPQALIKAFDLKQHPEGGWYRETYRSQSSLSDLPGMTGTRSISTAIYYMLSEGQCSAFHRIKSDEVWHFYDGGPLIVVELDPTTGALSETTLGADIAAGHLRQHVVPAGRWFGAKPAQGTQWSFVGCTVAPGFDFADFELADRNQFLKQYPAAIRWNELFLNG